MVLIIKDRRGSVAAKVAAFSLNRPHFFLSSKADPNIHLKRPELPIVMKFGRDHKDRLCLKVSIALSITDPCTLFHCCAYLHFNLDFLQ